MENKQEKIEDFDWQKIIEEYGQLDEEERNHFMYRKERLMQLMNEQDDEANQEKITMTGVGRGQKNDHLDFNFMTKLC